jgi:hypothetical protein
MQDLTKGAIQVFPSLREEKLPFNMEEVWGGEGLSNSTCPFAYLAQLFMHVNWNIIINIDY